MVIRTGRRRPGTGTGTGALTADAAVRRLHISDGGLLLVHRFEAGPAMCHPRALEAIFDPVRGGTTIVRRLREPADLGVLLTGLARAVRPTGDATVGVHPLHGGEEVHRSIDGIGLHRQVGVVQSAHPLEGVAAAGTVARVPGAPPTADHRRLAPRVRTPIEVLLAIEVAAGVLVGEGVAAGRRF